MSTSTSGELGILLGIILVCLYALQRCNLQTPPFFLGLLLGGWLALTFLVGHGGGGVVSLIGPNLADRIRSPQSGRSYQFSSFFKVCLAKG